MARGLSIERRRGAALQAGRRMIARGDRPIYRLQATPDGRYVVEGCPWFTVASAACRQDTADAARAAIAEWLGTGPDAFDIELR